MQCFDGVVAKVNSDGTYDIDYDDGDKEQGVRADLIYVTNVDYDAAATGTHATDVLTPPTHLDDEAALLGPFMPCADKTKVAEHGYEYWGGADQPWRHGLDKSPVTDPSVIASEEKHKLDAEAADEDTAGMPAHAEKLRGCGVRVDFLLALTLALEAR